MIIFSFLILLLTNVINSRSYEAMSQIKRKIFLNLNDLYLDFIIYGTNNYAYHLQSEDILYYFKYVFISEEHKEILTFNTKINIIFNLNIYEYTPSIIDFTDNNTQHSEKIIADINFNSLKFHKVFEDFSFGMKYNIENMDNDILINFENIDKLNTFKYLLLEEKSDIYESNNNLFDFLKKSIINNLEKEINKSLVYYPECDSLNYFKSIIQYIKNEPFTIDLKFNSYFIINKCKILEFNYDEITKNNRTIIFNNVIVKIYMEIYSIDYYDYEEDDVSEETLPLLINYIKIDENKTILYGKDKSDNVYALNALKLVIKKAEDILGKKNN